MYLEFLEVESTLYSFCLTKISYFGTIAQPLKYQTPNTELQRAIGLIPHGNLSASFRVFRKSHASHWHCFYRHNVVTSFVIMDLLTRILGRDQVNL